MIDLIQQFVLRNMKHIPYFFERKPRFEHNLAHVWGYAGPEVLALDRERLFLLFNNEDYLLFRALRAGIDRV
jgi:hypothetical protein